MILTSHILAGAVVAEKINNPLIGLPLAFLSHFVLDALPHQDYSIAGINRPKSKSFATSAGKILIDASLGLGLVIFATLSEINFLYLIAAIFFSILPDFLQFLNRLNPRWFKKFNHWHCNIIHLIKTKKGRTNKPKNRQLADKNWDFQILFSAGLFIILIWS